MSENRCRRCSRKLGNPSATYGSTCARIMGVKEVYERSSRDTRDDFDHVAHATVDKLSEMGIDWGSEEGQILFRQLFAQEFGNAPQVIPAKDSKGSIEQTLRNKDTDYMIANLSSRTETIASPKENETVKSVNYQTTEKSSLVALDHFYDYDDSMSKSEKDAWIKQSREILASVEMEYSEENLKNRAYDSIRDIRIELDRIQYLNAYVMAAYRGRGANGEYLPPEVRAEALAVTRRALNNMERDIIARAILTEAQSGMQEDFNAVAQTIINRYNSSIGAANENGVKNKRYYEVSSDTLNTIQKSLLGNDKVEDVLRALFTYGIEDGKYHNYSIAGLVLASSQYTGLTGDGNAPALNPLQSNKSTADIEMAYTAAKAVMAAKGHEPKIVHADLADNEWTSFRGPATIERQKDGAIIYIEKKDGKIIKRVRYAKGQWLHFGYYDSKNEKWRGNYYLGEGKEIK